MEKRTILAIALTFLIIIFWSVLQNKIFPPPPKPPAEEVKKEAPALPPKTKEIKEGKPLTEETLPSKPKTVVKKEASVETPNFWAGFTTDGARLTYFKLKNYEDRVEESSFTVRLVHFVQGFWGKKKEFKKPEPLNLVNTSQEEGFPLGLTFTDSQRSISNGYWEVEKDQLRLLGPGEKGEITFWTSLENGLKVFKRYRFTSDKHTIDLEVEIQNATSREVPVQMGLEWTGKAELVKLAEEDNKDYGLRYAFLKGQKVEKTTFGGAASGGCTPGCSAPKKKIESFESSFKGNIEWYAFEGEYFAAVLIPPPAEKDLTLSVKGDEKNLLKASLSPSPFTLPPEQAIKIPFRVYLGPKEIDWLRELGVNAEKLVDFGFFAIVAKPLLWFLKLTNRVTSNFGIDIIILSILLKIIFIPLTQISMKSMKEMQKVQPEMARLKEKYKNDKAGLQQEMMLLYKRRKINPMSGCLPMLIQIPVFIALYNALQNAIEMRHAPFFLWIKDLSAKDPIYLSPIVMGASMFLQQKMTPTAADPSQAKMFMFMPILFTFFFLNFPSGLVLYWFINNVLSIAHQYYMNKRG
jgi:YidC/Oxa1 family membrane protein insertase